MKKTAENNAVKMLKEDHKKVKHLFDRFEDAESNGEKRQIALQACGELKLHARLEEQIFYPAVRVAIEKDELMAQAKEEHRLVERLISELENESDETAFNAKFSVLAENVRHHIKEEESEMLPEAEKTHIDMEDLAGQMAQLKQDQRQETSRQPIHAS